MSGRNGYTASLNLLGPASPGIAFTMLDARPRSDRGILDPRVGHDDVRWGIPVAVLVDTRIEAVGVINISLGDLELAIRRELGAIHCGHSLVRFHLSDRQTAGTHIDDLLALHFSHDGTGAGFSNLMPAILVQLGSEQIVAVIVMGVLCCSDRPGT